MKAGTRLLISLSLCAAVMILITTLTTQAAGKATVQTDAADYPPNTQVNVTGSGWLAGELVELTFVETSTTPPGGYTDGPFVFYATADGQGNIANGEFYTDDHDLGVHFLLTAKSTISGRMAQTTFTDDLPGLFQIDGNAIGGTASSHDWDQVYTDKIGSTSQAAGTGAIQFTIDGVNSASDDTFSNSPKDTLDVTTWKWGRKAVSAPKTDLAHGFAAAYQQSGYSTNGSVHTLLYVGTDRFASGSNSAISIWLLQHPIGMCPATPVAAYCTNSNSGTFVNKTDGSAETHAVGDLLIQASLGSTATVTVYKWIGGANPLQLFPWNQSQLVRAISTGALSVPWSFIDSAGSTSPLAQEFFEVGLDLNELFQATSENLPDFSSFIITTRTSTSQTATLNDFILGNVSSAPDIAVTKKADAATVTAGFQVGYTVSVSNVGVGDITGATLNDPLPAGAGLDLNWSLAGDSTSGVFQITGSQGSQTLTFVAPQNLAFNSPALVAHVVATSTNSDAGTLSNTATVAAPNEGGDFLSNNTSTAVITINRLNGLPVANAQYVETNEDTAKSITLTGDDGDAGLTQTLTFAIASYPANGTLSGVNPATGAVTYTPNANYNGPDSFTFTVTDEATSGGPAMTSAPATVSITVNPVNDTPVAANDSYSTNEDTPLTVAAPGVLGNDSDVDGDTLSALLVTGPSHGSLTLEPDGSFSYTPDANYHGSDSFTYKANDGHAVSGVTTVSITVTSVNDAPVATNDSYSTDEDTPLTVAASGVLANDSDLDGDTLTATLLSGPSNGSLTLNANGSFSYTPNADYYGPDSFTYTISDGHGGSATATVSITVNLVKARPTFGSAMSWVLHDSLTINGIRTGAPDAATAKIVFKLYGPSVAKSCVDPDPQDSTKAHNLLAEEEVTGVTSSGKFSTTAGFPVDESDAGTYRWVVSYTGDALNDGGTTACGDETHTIIVGEPPQQ
jgi:uncharacterized repeat protein (TIGR01451 family)